METISLIKNLEHPGKQARVDMVLDTDAYNEVDDQYAISYMLSNRGRLNVKAIYAAPFSNIRSDGPCDGMEKSYDEIKKVLSLIGGAEGIQVYKGSAGYLPDEKTPVASPAAEHLAGLAMEYSMDKPLYVAAIGAITNIASAIIINPKIIDNIVVIWIGGNALHWPETREFNMVQDIAAARVVFGCGVPLVQLPAMGVLSAFTVSEADLNAWLVGKNKICDYLTGITIRDSSDGAQGKPWTRVIWDVAAIAWLVDGRFFLERLERSPIPEYDGHYAHDCTRHFIKYVYHVNRDELAADLFGKLVTL